MQLFPLKPIVKDPIVFFFVFFIKFIYTGRALVHSSFRGRSSAG